MSLEVSAYRSTFPSPSRPPLSKLLLFFSLTGILTWCKLWFAYSLLDFIQLTWLTSQEVLISSQSLHPPIKKSLLNLVCFWARGSDATRGEVKCWSGGGERWGHAWIINRACWGRWIQRAPWTPRSCVEPFVNIYISYSQDISEM